MQNLLMDNKFADAEGQRRISLSRNLEEEFGRSNATHHPLVLLLSSQN
jgi:hypothetical protein